MEIRTSLRDVELSNNRLQSLFKYLAGDDNQSYFTIRKVESYMTSSQDKLNSIFRADIDFVYTKNDGLWVEKLSGLVNVIQGEDKVLAFRCLDAEHARILNIKIENYTTLSVRARNACYRVLGEEGRLRDLVNITEKQLRRVRNCGMTTINEIKREMNKYGLKLLSP